MGRIGMCLGVKTVFRTGEPASAGQSRMPTKGGTPAPVETLAKNESCQSDSLPKGSLCEITSALLGFRGTTAHTFTHLITDSLFYELNNYSILYILITLFVALSMIITGTPLIIGNDLDEKTSPYEPSGNRKSVLPVMILYCFPMIISTNSRLIPIFMELFCSHA